MWNGKQKAITFSYDDGITQDKRLVKLLNRYDLKATFNLNTEKLGTAHALWLYDRVTVAHCKFRPEEIRAVYEGHEIAGHTLGHPRLTMIEDDAEVIRQVEEDRIVLSDIAGKFYRYNPLACQQMDFYQIVKIFGSYYYHQKAHLNPLNLLSF